MSSESMASSSSTSSSSSTTSSLYDGTNLEIREPHCADCLRTESEAKEEEEETGGAPLQRCSRCGVMWYCNRECQQSDFPSHKFWCRNVHAARTKLQALAETLRNCKLPDGTMTNLFETRVGDFMDAEETWEYWDQRLELILALEHLAAEAESLEVRTLIADLYGESLRLNAKDPNGLRYGFPIALLRINRDDDAYCFCKYWITKTDEEDRRRRAFSKEGDWIYPREIDTRYKDIFKECENAENTIELRSLVSLAIIKMRLVAVYESRTKAIEAMSAHLSADELEEERQRIMGSAKHEHTLSDQRPQLDKVLDLIHSRNQYLIPALLYPDPLMELSGPNAPRSGSPDEARAMLPYCHSVWSAIPGAADYLEGRLGTSEPDYLPRRPTIMINFLT